MVESQEFPELHPGQQPADPPPELLGGGSADDGAAQGVGRTGERVGSYRLLERLGGGSMAAVYRAVDERSDRQVAIKVLLPDADMVMRQRFRQEARTHRNLHHPNIVPILEIGEGSGNDAAYIVMELVEGTNLSDLLEQHLRLPCADTARLLEPIALALDYAGRSGVVHRDVKPSNVLLRKAHAGTPGAVQTHMLPYEVVPLLSDFGIARALDAPELTSAGRTIGTPTYMSPEQCADSHEIDGRSDIYSLGAVFYRCVVGRPPFVGTTTQILHSHVYEPLSVPDDLLEELPEIAVEILRRALAKEPDRRYRTAAEMSTDFERLAHLRTTTAAGDSTATMAVLPSVRSTTSNTVIVPAPSGNLSSGRPIDYVPSTAAPPRLVTPASVPAVSTRPRWIGVLLGTVLTTLVVGGALFLAVNLLPGDILSTQATPSPPVGNIAVLPPSATPVPATPEPGTPEAAPGGAVVSNPPTPTPTATSTATAEPSNTPVSAASTPPASVTPSVPPTPAGSIEGYWADATDAYVVLDWQSALDYLTLVQRIDAEYERATAEQMLADIYAALAAQNLSEGAVDQASEWFAKMATLKPDDGRLASVAEAVQNFAQPEMTNTVMVRFTLASGLLGYGQELQAADNPCVALELYRASATILPDLDATRLLEETEEVCAEKVRERTIARQLATLEGRFLYSTQDGESYQIYLVPAAQDAPSELVINNGAQPALEPGGSLVAFHSMRPDAQGILLFDLGGGLLPDQSSGRVTSTLEDALDAPPTWSLDRRRLAFGSTVGDRRTRVYLTNVDGDGRSVFALGRDPAWRPTSDWIVYNGYNEAGENPGLWISSADGLQRNQLTDNGNDLRPAWTPDGSSVVFMSQRDGNWDVYKLSIVDRTLIRLTDNPAQDGLPTVSPDGQWVAFASDRSGFWQIWTVPIDGGDAFPLLTLNGVLTNWLEHALQWIP